MVADNNDDDGDGDYKDVPGEGGTEFCYYPDLEKRKG